MRGGDICEWGGVTLVNQSDIFLEKVTFFGKGDICERNSALIIRLSENDKFKYLFSCLL